MLDSERILKLMRFPGGYLAAPEDLEEWRTFANDQVENSKG
jgi:hypothetical protein